MLALVREDQPLIQQIIGAAEETFPDFPSYALPTQPTSWHRGPVVLLGDAVHAISPSSGQGASMALEDAVVLAKCLQDLPNLEQAFGTYEQLGRERTAKMFELGQRGDAGKFVTRPLQQWFRDLTTPLFLKLFANPKASDWIYSYRVEWDEPIEPIRACTPAASSGQQTVSPAGATKWYDDHGATSAQKGGPLFEGLLFVFALSLASRSSEISSAREPTLCHPCCSAT